MPGLYVEPSPVTKGRGSALGTGARKTLVRRRRKARSTTLKDASNSGGFIGQELVNWNHQNSHSVREEEPEKKKKSGRKSQSSSRKEAPQTTPMISPPLSEDARTVRPLIRHALALDTRVIDTNDEIGNDILANFHTFIDTLSYRGARPEAVVATTTVSSKDGVCVQVLGLASPSFKATAARLSSLVDKGEQGVCIPQELSAESSWNLLASMGELNYLFAVLCSL
jgi:hypothetical protein